MRSVHFLFFLLGMLVALTFAVHAFGYVLHGADMVPAPGPGQEELYASTPLGRFRDLALGELSPVLVAHAGSSALALFLAPLQLALGVTRSSPVWHRRIAVPYVVCVFVGSLTGFFLAPGAWGGLTTSLGYAAYGVAWMFTTTRGLVHISQRDVDEHKEWMGRSLALAFAGATIPLWTLVMLGLQVPASVGYPFAAWWGWVSNLIAAELLIRATIGSSSGRAAWAR